MPQQALGAREFFPASAPPTHSLALRCASKLVAIAVARRRRVHYRHAHGRGPGSSRTQGVGKKATQRPEFAAHVGQSGHVGVTSPTGWTIDDARRADAAAGSGADRRGTGTPTAFKFGSTSANRSFFHRDLDQKLPTQRNAAAL